MGKILLGKDVTASINERLTREVLELKEQGKKVTLGIVRVGENPSDLAYERGAIKRAETVGIDVKHYVYEEDITTEQVVIEIEKINEDPNVDGVLIFRPLPKHIDDDAVRNALNPSKDIDGISDISMAGVYSGKPLGYPPCTAEAAMEILKFYDVGLTGKKVAVIGRSLVIGRPVAMMLMQANATVTICHTKTKNLSEITRDADIIIAAAGQAKGVKADHCKAGQVIIDVGINFDEDGKMCGDVDFDSVSEIVSAITPVPGGVGGVTTGILMSNTLEAAKGNK
ncbi:MAG: bifunctional 5,10-methylenetetrahydrofolate dehydrogenase/5,10-methenyltetrahydrofolate cyclohydrolase [Anaerovoracaceae bacterium]